MKWKGKKEKDEKMKEFCEKHKEKWKKESILQI